MSSKYISYSCMKTYAVGSGSKYLNYFWKKKKKQKKKKQKKKHNMGAY